MFLENTLRACLLILAGRSPGHPLNVEGSLLRKPIFHATSWTAEQLITTLEAVWPQALQEPAILLISEGQCSIYLLTYSIERPALHIHCQEKVAVQ